MPENVFRKVKQNIPSPWKTCFWAATVVGLIAHIYKMTNWLPNWDSLVFRYDAQNMLEIGRWFLPVAAAPSSFYDLPWVTGLLAIVFHALGAICICHLFDIKRKSTALLIGAVVVSFPTVTSVMLYNYVADAYSLSFLLACLAAVLMTRQKPNYWLAVACITLSVGIYQAYITVTIMLLLCYLITQAMQRDTQPKTVWLQSVKFLATGAVGMALYYGVLMLLLTVTGTKLLEYQGMNSATSLAGLDILGSLYTIKESFVNYFFDCSAGFTVFHGINIAFVVLTVVFYVVELIRNKPPVLNVILLVLCAVMLPFAASILAFVNSTVDYHNLMKMGFVVFYVFLLLQYDKRSNSAKMFQAVKAWGILAVTFALVFVQILIANVSYHKLNLAYEKSYGVLIRIADRIEQTEGSEACEKLLVVGHLPDSEAYSAQLPPDMTGTTDGLILRADDEIVGQSVLCTALNDYGGTSYTFVTGEEKAALLATAEVQDLKNWPAKQSVCVINDVVVVKLGNEE